MKKLFTLIFVIALIAVMTVPAMASQMLFIDEFNFFISIPDGYYVLTRDKTESSAGWALFGESEQAQLMQAYEQGNVYLNAISENFAKEIVLTVNEGQDYKNIYNFNDYKDDKIRKELSKEWDSTMKELGIQADDFDIYQNGDLKYIYTKGSVSSGNGTTYVKLYSTVVNGRMLQCNIRSYNGALTAEDEAVIKHVVDSIKFTQIMKNPNKSAGSSALGSAVKWVVIAAVAGIFSAVAKSASKKKTAAAAVPAQQASPVPQQPADGSVSPVAEPVSVPVRYVCRNCGESFGKLTAFCPNCGGNGTLEEKTGE